MKKWEYRVLTPPGGVLAEEALNELGAQGWELVAMRVGNSTTELVFKRSRATAAAKEKG